MVRIGVGQADFTVGDQGGNLDKIHDLLEQARQVGVNVLALPELANSGYTFESPVEVEQAAEVISEGPASRLLQDWSGPDRAVVCGICEKEGARYYNSAAIFYQGRLEAVYRKVHLFADEKRYFSPGEVEPPVVNFHGHRLGVMICFDWFFPEMARSLALRGAQIILHPANLVLPYCQKAMLTRSIENRIFTATANRYGEERGLTFSGFSQITSPTGDLLAQAAGDYCGVVTAEVDLTAADDKWVTPQNHLFQDRKPGLYRSLVE